MITKWRWVLHDVYGLKLFFDIAFGTGETCTGKAETFAIEIKVPEKVLRMIAGQTIPKLPKEIGDND